MKVGFPERHVGPHPRSMSATAGGSTITAHMTVAMVGLTLGAMAFVPRTHATCAHYGPEVVRLTGHLSIDKEYGPPGYGETPAKDEKLHVAILHLTHPLDVCGDSRDVMTSEADYALSS
jgi:hypothetical protein